MSRKSLPSRTSLSGGLPVFSPRTVATALVKPREDEPEAPPRESRPLPERRVPTTTISIDLGSVIKGAVALAEYASRWHLRKRAAARELDRRALELASEYQGLLGVPDLLMRADCDRDGAQSCLTRLEKAQFCRFLCLYQEEAMYVFPGYLPRAWECEYCSNHVPTPLGTPRSPARECECCGAAMVQKILT